MSTNQHYKPRFHNLQIVEPVVKPLRATENGEYTVPEGVDGFSSVKVDVPIRYDEGFTDGYNQGYDKGYPEGYEASQRTIVLQEKTTTENGEFIPDEGFTGFSKFTVDVPERKEEQTKALDIVENGSYNLIPDEGKVLSSASVNVNIPPKEEQEKTLSVTENGSYEVIPEENKALSKVNVDVNVAFDGEVGKPYIDTSKITDFRYFCSNDKLNNFIDKLDTSNGINFMHMFSDCYQLKSISSLETINGTNFSYMFYSCEALVSIPPLDTSNGTNFSYMFYSCRNLQTIPPLDTSNGTNFSYMFQNCRKLETVSLIMSMNDLLTNTFYNCTALKNITIGEGWAVSIYLNYSNNLTVESLHGMIENLADLTGKTAKTFQIGATNLAKIDEEHLAMLQNKNWNYS